MNRSLGRFAVMLVAVPFAGLVACNAILGAGDYHVGKGTDGGNDNGEGGSSGTAEDAGADAATPGTGGISSGGSNAGGTTGAGGRASGGAAGKGTGGRATGTGGAKATGGAMGFGGKAGAGGSSGALTPDDFVGEWDTSVETVVTDCGDGNPTTDMTSDAIEWARGTGNTIEATFLSSCTLVATLSGRSATISPPITCSDSGITYLVGGTFTIAANGTATLDEKVTFSSGGVSCDSTATGSFTKYVPPQR